jgi:hypothetical protein
MNYLKIYNQIIERSKTRKITGYKERHHIIPKCMNGTNNKDNIAELTAKEHFICHMLLCNIYPKNNKLLYAVWRLTNSKGKQGYKISSRTYENLKNSFSLIRKGIKLPIKTINKMKGKIPWNKGKTNIYSPKVKSIIIKTLNHQKGGLSPSFGLKRSKETIEKIKKYRTGKHHSDDTKCKMSKSRINKKWMNNGHICIQSNYKDINYYLDNGYIFGRIKNKP